MNYLSATAVQGKVTGQPSLHPLTSVTLLWIKYWLCFGYALTKQVIDRRHRALSSCPLVRFNCLRWVAESLPLITAHIIQTAERFAIPERWIRAVTQAESAGPNRLDQHLAGKPRQTRTPAARSFTNRVLKAAKAAGRTSGAISSRSGHRFSGRGGGRFARSRLFSPRRRVVISARIARHQSHAYRAALLADHLAYLKREGVSRDGEVGLLFDARDDRADERDFVGRCHDDRHHFRFTISLGRTFSISPPARYFRELKMRRRLNASLPAALVRQVEELAFRKRVSRSSIVGAALESFLSPDGLDLREAAFTRRLDHLSRQTARIERDLKICNEALGLFVHVWLTVTPSVAAEGQAAARAKGHKRFDTFITTVSRRLQSSRSFAQEIADDIQRQREADLSDDVTDIPATSGSTEGNS